VSTESLEWTRRIQRLAALAQNGLTFAQGQFDHDRYAEIQRLAAEMLAHIADVPTEKVLTLLAQEQGYATPKVDVRGAVFDGERILLVREVSDGRWTLPGGWADPGDTPREAVEREIREESGYEARAVKLAAVYDRARQGHTPSLPFATYKLFFICERVGGAARASAETDAVDFFSVHDLPPLSLGRVTARQIRRLLDQARHPEWPADFD
jgi:ADP-ribose pyrophosphatase YjhB (NUDIX family)